MAARFLSTRAGDTFPRRGAVFPFFHEEENTMQSSSRDRVVCLLLGGTGRRARNGTRLSAVVRPWLHRAIAFLAALAL